MFHSNDCLKKKTTQQYNMYIMASRIIINLSIA
jgi:hypothetical protein